MSLSLLEGAVLMSYLTFAFEAATFSQVKHPAWGVNANLVVRRMPELKFDTRHAKAGGGKDVDLCLRIRPYGRFDKVPRAKVDHDFWKFSFCMHFLGWGSRRWSTVCPFSGALIPIFSEHS